MTGLTPGLYGKLPAHGDFVARGWAAADVAALDAWLTGGLAAIRDAAADDDAFAATMTGAPLWRGYIPPGACGAAAFHLALAPSIDSAGRYFFIAGGVTGAAASVWAAASQSPAFADAVEAATYDALGGSDADGFAAAIAAATPASDARAIFLAGVSLPPSSAWWIGDPAEGAPVGLTSAEVDAALLARLVAGGQA